MRTRTIDDAALAGVMVLGRSESVGACDWSCRHAALGPTQDRAELWLSRLPCPRHGQRPFRVDRP